MTAGKTNRGSSSGLPSRHAPLRPSLLRRMIIGKATIRQTRCRAKRCFVRLIVRELVVQIEFYMGNRSFMGEFASVSTSGRPQPTGLFHSLRSMPLFICLKTLTFGQIINPYAYATIGLVTGRICVWQHKRTVFRGPWPRKPGSLIILVSRPSCKVLFLDMNVIQGFQPDSRYLVTGQYCQGDEHRRGYPLSVTFGVSLCHYPDNSTEKEEGKRKESVASRVLDDASVSDQCNLSWNQDIARAAPRGLSSQYQ